MTLRIDIEICMHVALEGHAPRWRGMASQLTLQRPRIRSYPTQKLIGETSCWQQGPAARMMPPAEREIQMNIETARAIIADSSRAPHQADHMIAGRVLYDHWQRHPEELKPAGGTPTRDAKPTRQALTRDLADAKREMKDLLRLARDQDLSTTTDPKWIGAQQLRESGVVSDPTVGPKRILKLDGPATAYFIQSAGVGVWLCQSVDIEGIGDPGRTEIPATPTGDLARHKRTQAQRDTGAAFAARFNEAQRAKWGR